VVVFSHLAQTTDTSTFSLTPDFMALFAAESLSFFACLHGRHLLGGF
jgi:hypothetical protein